MFSESSGMTTREIGEQFIDYFRENDHKIIEGAGIIPVNDPTLLYINSGMAPLKTYFTGEDTPPYERLANSQVCIRTTDIEDVGDPHHATSFRMLGNWSFGSYGKTEAIDLAVGLLSERFKIPKEKLFATTFETDATTPEVPSDDISTTHWKKYLSVESIVPSGPVDNFWGPAGESGPCGPCTEVFYDRGLDYGLTRDDGARSIEIWNAGVFMEYNKESDGRLTRLSKMCVDAGAGLERFAMVMQNAPSIHQIDQYAPAYDEIKQRLANDSDARLAFDHLKTSQILIESGVTPDRKGGGYILRRLIRRTLATLALNEIDTSEILNMHEHVANVVDPVPSSIEDYDSVRKILTIEMNGFSKVLKAHKKFIDTITSQGEVTAQQVFNATSSQGIPVDLIRDACHRINIQFPESGYAELSNYHQKISKG